MIVSLRSWMGYHLLHRTMPTGCIGKAGNVCVVTPKSPDARDAEEYPVYRYSSVPIPMRKPYRLGFPRIDWPFHERISRLHSSWYMPIVPFLREHWPCRLPENSMFRL